MTDMLSASNMSTGVIPPHLTTQVNDPYQIQARLLQERIDKHHANKERQQERVNERIILDKLMLQAYYERLDRLATYNAQAQLVSAQAEQGRVLDIEV